MKTSKSRFCNFLRRKGKREGRAIFGFRAFRGQGSTRPGPRPGLREGQGAGQAGRRGRAQRAGQGCKG